MTRRAGASAIGDVTRRRRGRPTRSVVSCRSRPRLAAILTVKFVRIFFFVAHLNIGVSIWVEFFIGGFLRRVRGWFAISRGVVANVGRSMFFF